MKNKLYCFSPPVMIATLTTEIVLAIYTFWRYRLNEITKLSLVVLICLATFQLAEYNVCTGYGLHAEAWSKLGFVMITALPALGIDILYTIAGKQRDKIVYGSYGLMATFMLTFLINKSAFIGHQCEGNYVIFQLGPSLTLLYEAYYYALLLSAIFIAVKWINKIKSTPENLDKISSIKALVIGYLVFLIPTAISNTIAPSTRRAIPSVMCGFAVLFAFILVFYIVPRTVNIKQQIHLRHRS